MKEIYFDETFCFWRNFLQLCLAHQIYINPENNKVNFKLTWSLSAILFAINKNNKLFELKFIRNQLELMTFLKKVCYQNITNIDFALNIVYQCQEKQHKRKVSEQKISKEKWPRKFPKAHTIWVLNENGWNHHQNAVNMWDFNICHFCRSW